MTEVIEDEKRTCYEKWSTRFCFIFLRRESEGMIEKENSPSPEIAILKLQRAASETSEDVKLVFLLSGIEALYETREDRKTISEIIGLYDKTLSENEAKILGQSYYRRNQMLHGKISNIHHIKKLVSKLEKILRILIQHQVNPEFLSGVLDIQLNQEQEVM